MNGDWQSKKPLREKRILVCGKGGSGKSTIVSLLATILQRKAYKVMVLDGDASNPEGLVAGASTFIPGTSNMKLCLVLLRQRQALQQLRFQ